MSIHWKKEEIDDIIYKYLELKQGCTSIAQKYGVSINAINNVLKHNNIAKRTIQQANKKIITLSEEQINQILYNYTVLGQGLQTCGKGFGYSQYMVEKLLKERGIRKRNYTESKQCQRLYTVDDNFFKVQSPDMAYILGLLASDGNISNKENCFSITLQASDKEILEKIAQSLKSNRKIDTYTTKAGKEYSKIQIWSSVIKQDLAKYGILPNKTLTLEPPTLLQSIYIPDYIRGFFDGDGSVYYKENSTIIQFDGASKKLIIWIREFFNSLGCTTPSFYHTVLDSGIDMYRLTYYNQEVVKRVFKIMHQSNSDLFLKRKYEKFPRDFTSQVLGRKDMLNL